MGLCIACLDERGLLDQVAAWIDRGEKRSVAYVNAHCLNLAARSEIYRCNLKNTSLLYPDGAGAVWAGKVLGTKQLHKMTGADWIYDFCARAEKIGWRIYILAGKPGVAMQAKQALQRQFPGLCIVGARDGYFEEKSEGEILAEMISLAPDVVFVGMGVPRQEAWVSANAAGIPSKIFWSVGALFDYIAGIEPRAPRWMRRLTLEWFWRLLVDPRGKWSRYVLGIPEFIGRVLMQKFIN